MFGKSINNLGWHEFVRKLSYKLERHGFCFHKVDRYFPAIKLCNNCCVKNITLKLRDTRWTFNSHSTMYDGDINIALNR